VPPKQSTTKTSQHKRPSPDARAVAALALLLEGIEDSKFEEGLAAIITSLKPRIKIAWSKRRLKKEVYDPLAEAVKTGDSDKVLEALYTNRVAVELINRLHQDHLARQVQDQTLRDAKAG